MSAHKHNCKCPAHQKSTDDCSSNGVRSRHVFSYSTMLSAIIPHMFCCLLPVTITLFFGGAFAVFLHNYAYLFTVVIVMAVTFVIHKIKQQHLSFMQVCVNIGLALLIAFIFNMTFHRDHNHSYMHDEHNHFHEEHA